MNFDKTKRKSMNICTTNKDPKHVIILVENHITQGRVFRNAYIGIKIRSRAMTLVLQSLNDDFELI